MRFGSTQRGQTLPNLHTLKCRLQVRAVSIYFITQNVVLFLRIHTVHPKHLYNKISASDHQTKYELHPWQEDLSLTTSIS